MQRAEKIFLGLFLLALPFQFLRVIPQLSIYQGTTSPFWTVTIYASDLFFIGTLACYFSNKGINKLNLVVLCVALGMALFLVAVLLKIIPPRETFISVIYTLLRVIEIYFVAFYFAK